MPDALANERGEFGVEMDARGQRVVIAVEAVAKSVSDDLLGIVAGWQLEMFAGSFDVFCSREGELASLLRLIVPGVEVVNFAGAIDEGRFDAIGFRLRFLAVLRILAVMQDEFLVVDTCLRQVL